MDQMDDLRKELATLLHLPDGEQTDTDIIVAVSMARHDANLFGEDFARAHARIVAALALCDVAEMLDDVTLGRIRAALEPKQ